MSVPPYNFGHRALPERSRISDGEWLEWAIENEPKSLKAGSYCRKLGVEFKWTSEHLKSKDLEPMRKVGDPLIDAIFKEKLLNHHEDLMEQLLRLESNNNETVKKFMTHVRTVPSWVDWAAVDRAQRFFNKHGIPSIVVLFNFSLVGGFSAPRINKVLLSTGYLHMNYKVTSKRLIETMQMIHDSMQGPESLQMGEEGWNSCVRVRFLHAHVRNRLLDSGRWDIAEYGVPINQEDMQATQLSFSYNVLSGLEQLGFRVTDQNREDLIHLWRYIGYLMGIEDRWNPCKSFSQAKAVIESIICHQVQPDDTTRAMAHHVIASAANYGNFSFSFDAHAQLSRMFMGDVLADILELPKSRKWFYVWKTMFALLKFNLSWMPEKVAIALNKRRVEEILRMIGDRTDFGFKKVLTKSEAKKIESDVAAKRTTRGLLMNYLYLIVLLSLVIVVLAFFGVTLGVVSSAPDWLGLLPQ